jgi:hypothetical protein
VVVDIQALLELDEPSGIGLEENRLDQKAWHPCTVRIHDR